MAAGMGMRARSEERCASFHLHGSEWSRRTHIVDGHTAGMGCTCRVVVCPCHLSSGERCARVLEGAHCRLCWYNYNY